MKSLQELLDQCSSFMTDMQVIQEYFVQNNLEDEAVAMIPLLLEKRKRKAEQAIDYARTWAPLVVDVSSFVKDKKVAELLNKVQLYAALSYPLDKEPALLEEAKTVVPNTDLPKMFFRPAVGYLAQYGIYFKGHECPRAEEQSGYPFNLKS